MNFATALTAFAATLAIFPITVPIPLSDIPVTVGNGYDKTANIIDNIGALSSREKTHFKKYLQLIEINRRKADNYIEQLLSIQQMDDDLSVMAAHERTDIKVTNEMRKHDDDIMMDDSEWE